MKPLKIMLIAGEASGDILAAELVREIRRKLDAIAVPATDDYQPLRTNLAPVFFGAGGPRMAEAGVELAVDMTRHSVIGLAEALRNLAKFRRIFHQLLRLAQERLPDLIICVDFSGFNRRFAHAIRKCVHGSSHPFANWNPRLVQYVSPQVWASREGRIYKMATAYDLLLVIFPFEKDWYRQRVPRFPVEFVGHPMFDRYAHLNHPVRSDANGNAKAPLLAILPGSRPGELSRHLPVMLPALETIRQRVPEVRATMVLPAPELVTQARAMSLPDFLTVQCGGLTDVLPTSTAAIASTGTVTMECAFFGVPTVALYKTSWSTYQIGKRIVKVRYLAMPNILADEPLFPELIQDAATPESIATETIRLLTDTPRREKIRARLREVILSLGGPGASERAARAILRLLPEPASP
jgi:lipid-A-disaccharide synthase